jgi:hypothetical protein
MQHTVIIPSHVFEEQLPQLFNRLHEANHYDEISIDISRVEFLSPAAIVTILARCHQWKRQNKNLCLIGLNQCSAAGYLKRMDFLQHLGINHGYEQNRHPPAGRFVPIQSLTFATGSVDLLASEITQCILPESSCYDDEYRLIQYATGELLSNGKYHSEGRAFVSAQFFPKRNLVRIAIADDGVGIRQKFLTTSRASEAADANSAIRLALIPGVSSALLSPSGLYAARNHRGVGLSLTRELVKGANGEMLIATEDGWFYEKQGEIVPHSGTVYYGQGTLVAATFHRDHIADYTEMHAKAMRDIGMFSEGSADIFLD